MVQQFTADIERSIEGSGGKNVNTNELSGGARINRFGQSSIFTVGWGFSGMKHLMNIYRE
ncbi:hypothetical protein PRIPAC_71088 [Pristionchus pacificus]|uniref:Uncharacterized protein n=1 Tax=Pristionchus pacificus TaxID=54126 RepID=A0A2A6BG26_PRIPA|nr:hypothetical protein PRIPAC_71088 [Pristionchus pacificus]|eukprot:PDM64761.1 hypothetical protein PRIPAC_53017 [Pristionchus pacificus]